SRWRDRSRRPSRIRVWLQTLSRSSREPGLAPPGSMLCPAPAPSPAQEASRPDVDALPAASGCRVRTGRRRLRPARGCYTSRMPSFEPFVGLVYDPSVVGSIASVTAPPYDVIDEPARARYLDASPHS